MLDAGLLYPVRKLARRKIVADGKRQRSAANGAPWTSWATHGHRASWARSRAADVYRAMDELLPGVYEETDIPDRYSFVGGSTAGGAVVYDDGLFLYSHHAFDPCSLRGARYDLVRLHRFGDLDDEASVVPVNRLPSITHGRVRVGIEGTSTVLAANRERLTADFGLMTEARRPTWLGGRPRRANPALEDNAQRPPGDRPQDRHPRAGDQQRPADPAQRAGAARQDRIQRAEWYAHADGPRAVARAASVGRGAHPRGEDVDDSGVRWYLQTGWRPGERPVRQGRPPALVMRASTYNPLLEYLGGLQWDGTPRLDTPP